MASLRKKKSKFWLARGRRKDGTGFEIKTSIPQEPPATSDPTRYATTKADLKAQAFEAAQIIEGKVRGDISEEEFQSRLQFISRKVVGQHSTMPLAEFLIRWVWEHVIRNRLSPGSTSRLCRMVFGLLEHIGDVDGKTVHDLVSDDFDAFVLKLRQDSYAPNSVNNDVVYLQSLGREIKKASGIEVTGNLELEQPDTAERLPFSLLEINNIFKAVHVMKRLAGEWTTLLLILLYTAMRPENAARVKRRDIDLEKGTIRVKSTKNEAFRKTRLAPKPMHKVLLRYLKAMLSDEKLKPEDFLCPLIAHSRLCTLDTQFGKILEAARIDPLSAKDDNRLVPFSQKTLYSFRHTANVWLGAAGASDEDQKIELGDSTDQALEHYQHPEDSAAISARREKINAMPAVDVAWPGNANNT